MQTNSLAITQAALRLNSAPSERYETTVGSRSAISINDHVMTVDEAVNRLQSPQDLDKLIGIRSIDDAYEAKDFRLQKNETSRLHQLVEACLANDVIRYPVSLREIHQGKFSLGLSKGGAEAMLRATSFVIQHDWAGAFSNAEDFETIVGDFRLPYESCVFEFKFNDVYFLVFARQANNEQVITFTSFVKTADMWVNNTKNEHTEMTTFRNHLEELAMRQIRAVCIGLEAEVAEHEVIRAAHKLNKKRIEKKQPPLVDYHIVTLSKRTRASRLHSSQEYKGVRRLHFRRGHWRHFETRKTWIKWMLVGNPDLGFIDKDYKV